MYTIPINFDLNTLRGSIIIQICFTANTITFFFEKAGSFEKIGFINTEGSFAFLQKGKRSYYEEICPVQHDYGLLKLLEKKVIRAYTDEKRNDLTLEFEENMSLELIGNEVYESYTININGERIII